MIQINIFKSIYSKTIPMFPETLLYNTGRLQAIAKDDRSFVPHMLKFFIRTISPMVEEIRKVSRKKQWGLVRVLAMGMQPAIVYLEIHSLKDTVLRIGWLAETGSPSPELEGLIDRLCKDIVPVREQMERELAGKPNPVAPDVYCNPAALQGHFV